MTKPTRPPPAPLVVYPWNKAPDWAQWAAVDECGAYCWHRLKPQIVRDQWTSDDFSVFDSWGYTPEWRRTLQERPPKKPKPQPAPGKRGKVRLKWEVSLYHRSFTQDIARRLASQLRSEHRGLRIIVRRLPIGRGRGGK